MTIVLSGAGYKYPYLLTYFTVIACTVTDMFVVLVVQVNIREMMRASLLLALGITPPVLTASTHGQGGMVRLLV